MAEIAVGHYIINVQDDHIDMSVTVAPPSAEEIKDMKLAKKDMFKVAVPSITVSAIGIIGDHSVGAYVDPYDEFLLKAYAVAVLATFVLGMVLLLLSVLLPRVPVSIAVAKKLVWVAVALVHIAVALKTTLRVVDFVAFK